MFEMQSKKGKSNFRLYRYAVAKFARSNVTKRSQHVVVAKQEIFNVPVMRLMLDGQKSMNCGLVDSCPKNLSKLGRNYSCQVIRQC
jgi:hypothetical protein